MIQDRKGFTLLELMVIVAIIAIIATMAFPHFAGYLAQERVKRVTRDLQIDLNQARIHAMERSVNTEIQFLDTGKGWTVVDADGNTIDQKTIDNDVTLTITDVHESRIPFSSSGLLTDSDNDDYRTVVMNANTDGDLWPIRIGVANSSLTMSVGVSIAGASRVID